MYIDQEYLINTYGRAEGRWLDEAIKNYWKSNDHYDNVDNQRLARQDQPDELIKYNDQKDRGCCGERDMSLGPSPAGYTYQYGFNHGH